MRDSKSPALARTNQLLVRLNSVTVVCSKICAPSSRARDMRRSSNRLRRTAISASSGNAIATDCRFIAMNSTVRSFPCGNARTRCSTSSRCSTGQHDGLMQSPQTFSRGNFSRSRSNVRSPASAQNAAQLDPAGPPPTMATSNICRLTSLRRPVPLTKEKPDLNKKVHEVPHKPGVYLMRDRFNRVIYVGKARDLRKRVGSYFMPSKIAVGRHQDARAARCGLGFRNAHRAQRSGIAAARRQADQGISAALQHLVSRRQTLSRRQSRSDGRMAAVSPGAFQEG